MKSIALFIFIHIILNILITNEKLIEYFSSEIKLVIKGSGRKHILNSDFNIEPSEVKIEGISNNCKKICNLEKDTNNVVLYFSTSVHTCENMFYLFNKFLKLYIRPLYLNYSKYY